MHVRGPFAPETEAEATTLYAAVEPAAEAAVRESTRAMGFDRAEYRDRVDAAVIETAREAVFASLLAVTVGSRSEYDDWVAANDYETTLVGSEHVDGVAWHVAPFADAVVAATFQQEEDAAVDTLRRQAFGRIYRERVG